MSYYVTEDSADAMLNRCTVIGTGAGTGAGNGIAYNAVISVTFSDESATEPVTLSQAKDWMRVDVTDDDSLITRLITGARIICEHAANLSFIERTVTAKIHNGLGNFYLPYGPIVGDVTSTDTDSIAIADYDVKDSHSGDMIVTYDAGYATLPENLRTALLCQVSWMYQNRGDVKLASGLSLESSLTLQQIRSV